MGARKYLTYGAIAAISLAEGAYESVFDAPGLLKPVLLIGIPVASGIVGEYTEVEKSCPKTEETVGEGFTHVMDVFKGFIKGGGLSAICETAGYGIVKLAKAFS